MTASRQWERLEANGWSVVQTHLTEFERDRPLYPGQDDHVE